MPLIIQSKPRQKSKRFEIPLLSYRRLFIPTLQFAKRVSAYPSLFPLLPVDIQPNGVFFIFFITLLLNLQICALCKSALSFSFGWFLPVLGENGKYSSKCNFIFALFGGEKWSKSRSRDYSPLDNPPTGGFCPPKQTTPPKPQKCSFCTVHKAVSQNRRATGARIWGSVRS